MIPALNSKMFNGCPGAMACATSCIQPMPSPWPNQAPREAGNSRMLLAKIAGITPAMFTFSGRWLVCAAKTLRPC
ncbi:hypothetical protein D3C81_1447400 [compost metagenome]